jgi:ribonuclease HIII
MTLSLGYIGKVKAENDIRKLLTDAGYLCREKKEILYGIQFDLFYSEKLIGCIRIFENKKGETKVDLSTILDKEHQKNIEFIISKSLIKLTENGQINLPQSFFFLYPRDKEELQQITNELTSSFNCIPQKPKNERVFSILKIDKITVLRFKNGTILIQGKKSKLADQIVEKIAKIYERVSKKELLKLLRTNLPLIRELEFEHVSKEFGEYNVDIGNYLSQNIYSYLNPNDKIEVRDGVLLLEFVKNKKLPLKNFACLVRNFAIAYEGFLIKLLSDLEILDSSHTLLDGRPPNIGFYLKPKKNGKSILEEKYEKYFLSKPALPKKMWSYWQECRNDYLHSDNRKFPIIEKIENAESKIREILSIMSDCLEVFLQKLKPEIDDIGELFEEPVIGIDEAGKGDYFGPLVVSAVFVDRNSIEVLASLGVRDSKLVSDFKIKELYEEIIKRCVVEVIKIFPEKYNKLYKDIKNLNHLLAWGHARALENILMKVKCKYVISDQFGDESLIKSRLMQLGKNITLIQTPEAERHIAVAAASIVARYVFLSELERLSQFYKVNLPKGSSEEVKRAAEKFIQKYGKENLSKVAKLHFKISKKVLGEKS